MILVDTSVWVDHLRSRNLRLVTLLETGRVLAHPFVIGEIALGSLRQRDLVLGALANLPSANVAAHSEVLELIDRNALFGRGIGFIDAHLLAATRLTPGATLWTGDKRLGGVAEALGLSGASAGVSCVAVPHVEAGRASILARRPSGRAKSTQAR